MFNIKNCFTQNGAGGLTQDITGDAASSQIIDWDVAGISVVGSKGPFLVCYSTAAFDNLTSLEIRLESDSDSGFATTIKHLQTWDIALASLTAGALLINQMLPNWDYQRYSRLYFNVIGSNPSVGTLFAALTDGPEPAQTDLDLVQES